MAKPTIQQVARAFFEAEDIQVHACPDLLTPQRDFYYIKDQGVFFFKARRSPEAPQTLAPFDESDFSDSSPLIELLYRFSTVNFPEISATPNYLRDLRRTLYTQCPNKITSLTTKYILFGDCTFSFKDSTFIPTTPDHLSPLAFPFTLSDLQNSEAPTFEAYLTRAFPDDPEATIRYFYTLIGYLLAPHTLLMQIPAFFYLYGETGSGKSVFLDLIEAIFPAYLKSSLTLESITTNRFAVANLAGKQLNIVDEDESEYVSGGKLKALTSFRPIEAERKYENSFRFYPQAKNIFASNHLATLKNMDSAVERRMHLIYYQHSIPALERDPHLKDKIIKELPAILSRSLAAITALLATKNHHFEIPKAFLEARHDFVVDSLSPLTFFEECFEAVPDTSICYLNSAMYRDYLDWCEENKKHPFSQMKFFAALKAIPGLLPTRSGHKHERGRSARKKAMSTFKANSSSLL